MRISFQLLELTLYGLILLLYLPYTPTTIYLKSLSLAICAGQPLFSAWYLSHYRITRTKARIYTNFRVQTLPTSVILLSVVNCIFPSSELIVTSLFCTMFVGFSRDWNHHIIHTLHSLATNIVLVILLDTNISMFTFIFIVTCCVNIILYDTRQCFSASEYILVTSFLTLSIYKTILDPNSSCVIVSLVTVTVFLVLPPRLDANTNFMVMALLFWFGVIFYKNRALHFHQLNMIANEVYQDINSHVALLVLWLCCVVFAVIIVVLPFDNITIATSRKLFHMLICLVYTTGLFEAPNLLGVSALLVALTMTFCEVMYLRQVSWLRKYLSKFRGAQDCDPLVLTPLFLLVGLSIPVWWCYGVMYGNKLTLRQDTTFLKAILPFCGIFTIGVGDGLAAIIGRKYGRNFFPASPKTIEGVLANVGGQFMFVVFLCPYLFWGSQGPFDFLWLIFVVLSNSLLEVYMRDIDNLMVPIYTTLALHCFDTLKVQLNH